jgi:hypothetical protein
MSETILLDELYLLPKSTKELDYLIKFLENNQKVNLKIGSDAEITGVQDPDHGSLAQEAFDYFISSGTNPDRVIFNQMIKNHRPVYTIIRS